MTNTTTTTAAQTRAEWATLAADGDRLTGMLKAMITRAGRKMEATASNPHTFRLWIAEQLNDLTDDAYVIAAQTVAALPADDTAAAIPAALVVYRAAAAAIRDARAARARLPRIVQTTTDRAGVERSIWEIVADHRGGTPARLLETKMAITSAALDRTDKLIIALLLDLHSVADIAAVAGIAHRTAERRIAAIRRRIRDYLAA